MNSERIRFHQAHYYFKLSVMLIVCLSPRVPNQFQSFFFRTGIFSNADFRQLFESTNIMKEEIGTF